MSSHNYTMVSVNLDQFQNEIASSSITVALSSVSKLGDDVTVAFKADLSAGEITTLNGLASTHIAVADEEFVAQVKVTEQPPFAQPTFRTKMDAIPNWVTCPSNTPTIMDFTLLAERYVTGGEIIFKNAKEGDYITACVYDGYNGGVIPEPYRDALCEAWPIVATYVEKRYLVPTITDGFGVLALDTYPLNAKISQYLQLRVTYHSSAEAGDRKVTVNYNLTQKL